MLTLPFELHERPDNQLVQADCHPAPAQLRAPLDVTEDRDKPQGLEDFPQGRGVPDLSLEFPADLEAPGFLGRPLEGQIGLLPGRPQPEGPAARPERPPRKIIETVLLTVAFADENGAHLQKIAADPPQVGGAAGAEADYEDDGAEPEGEDEAELEELPDDGGTDREEE